MQEGRELTDELLLSKFQNSGDQKFLAILFERYRMLVFGLCIKYLKDSEEARDACMDIYEKCVVKLQQHEVEKFRPWLYVLSRNHCFEKLRKAKTHQLEEKALIDMYSDNNVHPDTIEQEQLLARLDHCIEQLSGEQSRCIKAFYYKKLSYQRIAEKEKLSWNSVRSYIQNARRKLKKCIESN